MELLLHTIFLDKFQLNHYLTIFFKSDKMELLLHTMFLDKFQLNNYLTIFLDNVMYLETRRHLQNNTCMEINEYRKIWKGTNDQSKKGRGLFWHLFIWRIGGIHGSLPHPLRILSICLFWWVLSSLLPCSRLWINSKCLSIVGF